MTLQRESGRRAVPLGSPSPQPARGERPEVAEPATAIIVGGSGACGLGVVRSLSRAGVPAILLDKITSVPAMHSRYGRKIVVSALSGPGLVKDLLDLRETLTSLPVLFLTNDEAVLTVSTYRADIEGRFHIRLPAHDALIPLMHKASFQEIAESHGFPVPRSRKVEGQPDIARLAELEFPCIIKPTIKTAEYYEGRFERAYKAYSFDEAVAVCLRILPVVPCLMVQEWIEGDDTEIFFCLQYRGAGATVASFTGRKLSIWPPDVGTTASCTAAPDEHRVLHRLTEAFFQSVAFEGMGSMEYKRDPRTGRFLMIEPTVGRVDWQEEVATLHGVNIPHLAYLYETGAEVPAATMSEPVIWRDPWMHMKARRHVRRQPTGSETRMKVYDAYFRFDDPMPALFHARGAVARLLPRARRPNGKPK